MQPEARELPQYAGPVDIEAVILRIEACPGRVSASRSRTPDTFKQFLMPRSMRQARPRAHGTGFFPVTFRLQC